jgi:hypothetical protein
VALVTAIWLRSLIAVAIGQVAALAMWWLINEWKLRKVTGQGLKEWLRVWAVIIFSGVSYGVALWGMANIGWRILIYYAMATCVVLRVCFEELRFGLRLLIQANKLQRPQAR